MITKDLRLIIKKIQNNINLLPMKLNAGWLYKLKKVKNQKDYLQKKQGKNTNQKQSQQK